MVTDKRYAMKCPTMKLIRMFLPFLPYSQQLNWHQQHFLYELRNNFDF